MIPYVTATFLCPMLSPNSDGLNDIFLPAISAECPVERFSLSIFNRWGQRVFSSARPEQGWDGNFNGAPVDAGTYMYQIRFRVVPKEILTSRRAILY